MFSLHHSMHTTKISSRWFRATNVIQLSSSAAVNIFFSILLLLSYYQVCWSRETFYNMQDRCSQWHWLESMRIIKATIYRVLIFYIYANLEYLEIPHNKRNASLWPAAFRMQVRLWWRGLVLRPTANSGQRVERKQVADSNSRHYSLWNIWLFVSFYWNFKSCGRWHG